MGKSHIFDNSARVTIKKGIDKLAGAEAVIHAGSPVGNAMKAKKDRVENALNTAQAAVEGGIVPGGDVSILRAAKFLDNLELSGGDLSLGVNIVARAIKEPLRLIAANAGLNPSVVLDRAKKKKGASNAPGMGDMPGYG